MIGENATLDLIRPGGRCVVTDVNGEGRLGARLMDLGFLPGARIEVIRDDPLADPMKMRLDGFLINVRRAEAAGVNVETFA